MIVGVDMVVLGMVTLPCAEDIGGLACIRLEREMRSSMGRSPMPDER